MNVCGFIFITASATSGVMRGHRHVTCGLVTADWAKANATLSRNHEVVEQRNLVKTFGAIKFLTRDHRGLSPWWLKWI